MGRLRDCALCFCTFVAVIQAVRVMGAIPFDWIKVPASEAATPSDFESGNHAPAETASVRGSKLVSPTIFTNVRPDQPVALFDTGRAPDAVTPRRAGLYVNDGPVVIYSQVGGCETNAAALSVLSNTADRTVSTPQLMGNLCSPGAQRVHTYGLSDTGTIFAQATTSPPLWTDPAPRFAILGARRPDAWGSRGVYIPSRPLGKVLAVQNQSDGSTVLQRLYAGMWIAAPVRVQVGHAIQTQYWTGQVTSWNAEGTKVYVDAWSMPTDSSGNKATLNADPARFTGSIGYGTVLSPAKIAEIGWISSYSAYSAYVFGQPHTEYNILTGGEWNIVNGNPLKYDAVDPLSGTPYADGMHVQSGGAYPLTDAFLERGDVFDGFISEGGRHASFLDHPSGPFADQGASSYGDGFVSERLHGWAFVARQRVEGQEPGLPTAGITVEDGTLWGNRLALFTQAMPYQGITEAGSETQTPTPGATFSIDAASSQTPANGATVKAQLGTFELADRAGVPAMRMILDGAPARHGLAMGRTTEVVLGSPGPTPEDLWIHADPDAAPGGRVILSLPIEPTDGVTAAPRRNLALGGTPSQAALPPAAESGFPMIPAIAGRPHGHPRVATGGMVPMVVDTAGSALCFYFNAAWRCTALR